MRTNLLIGESLTEETCLPTLSFSTDQLIVNKSFVEAFSLDVSTKYVIPILKHIGNLALYLCSVDSKRIKILQKRRTPTTILSLVLGPQISESKYTLTVKRTYFPSGEEETASLDAILDIFRSVFRETSFYLYFPNRIPLMVSEDMIVSISDDLYEVVTNIDSETTVSSNHNDKTTSHKYDLNEYEVIDPPYLISSRHTAGKPKETRETITSTMTSAGDNFPYDMGQIAEVQRMAGSYMEELRNSKIDVKKSNK